MSTNGNLKVTSKSAMLTGARVTVRKRNGATWLYFGRLKVGKIAPGGVLEIKDYRSANCQPECVKLDEIGRQLIVMARRWG